MLGYQAACHWRLRALSCRGTLLGDTSEPSQWRDKELGAPSLTLLGRRSKVRPGALLSVPRGNQAVGESTQKEWELLRGSV